MLHDPPYEPVGIVCQGCRDLAEYQAGIDGEDPGLRVVLRPPVYDDADGGPLSS